MLIGSLEHRLEQPRADRFSISGSLAGRMSDSLTSLAVGVLEVRDRLRYREEFRAELGELPPRRQLATALRILVRAFELRAALHRNRQV